ncbi:MAG: hypothetical protein ACRD2Y_01005, partial [Terriglobales bacterium]
FAPSQGRPRKRVTGIVVETRDLPVPGFVACKTGKGGPTSVSLNHVIDNKQLNMGILSQVFAQKGVR